MHPLKLVQIGDSLGVALPLEVLSKLRSGADKFIFPSETTQSLVLSSHDPGIQEQLKAGREFIRDYRDALHMLDE